MNIRTVSRVGVSDWLLQRISAIYLLLYIILFAILLFKHSPLNFSQWHAIFAPLWFKNLSLIAFLSIVAHVWVGVWTIITDYVGAWKLRFILLTMVMLLLVVYFIWFIQIIWGVNL